MRSVAVESLEDNAAYIVRRRVSARRRGVATGAPNGRGVSGGVPGHDWSIGGQNPNLRVFEAEARAVLSRPTVDLDLMSAIAIYDYKTRS